MSRRRIQRQLPSETRQWIEQRLLGLERAERFEDAYALRMEMAELVAPDRQRSSLLQPPGRPPACVTAACMSNHPFPSRGDHLSDNGVLIDLKP